MVDRFTPDPLLPAPSARELTWIEHQRRRLGERKLWRLLVDGEDGQKWLATNAALTVIWSVALEQDDRVWLHVSVARPDRLPSYTDMARVKSVFVGEDRVAYSVWARTDDHVSIHPNCLHLWAPLEGDPPLPDFTRGFATI